MKQCTRRCDAIFPASFARNIWVMVRGASTGSVPHAIDVYLHGAERRAAQAFGSEPIVDLGIEWHGETALLSFVSGDRIDSCRERRRDRP